MLTQLLVRLFVKQSEKTDNPAVRERYGELAGTVGIVCNVGLFAAKLTVGLISGSIAIMADAVNNLSDAGSSIVALLGFKLAAKPADDEHPFGHGRLEYVAGLVVAVIIIAVGLNFLKGSAERIFHPVDTEVSFWGMVTIALAVPVKFWMFLFNRALGRKINSTVLQATAFDSLSDILTTSVVLIAVFLDSITSFPSDGIAGVIVALLIIVGGIKVVRDTINPLLGECPDRELVEELERKMLENPDICGVHDLIMHNYGPGRYFATAHAEVNSDCDPVQIHDSQENTERQVAMALPVRLTLHCDPFDRNDPEFKGWRLAATRAAEAIDAGFRIYDFRMFRTQKYLRLKFNLLVPRSCPLSHHELQERLLKTLRQRDPNVLIAVVIENSFV